MHPPNAHLPNPNDAIAVIGGGVSGLVAARELAQAGAVVALFDKGRRVAGRMSTREAEAGKHFDHGAQYFTAKSPRFEDEIAHWKADGVVAEWLGRLASLTCQGEECLRDEAPSPKTRYVGVPGMNAPAMRLAEQAIAAGATITTDVRVAPLESTGNRWRLTSEEGESLGDFARVLVTAPAPQAAKLFKNSPALASAAESVQVDACWAAMIAFDRRLEVEFDGAFINGKPEATPLSWVARNGSKPGRPAAGHQGDCWVLHGSRDWSHAKLDMNAELVLRALIAGFAVVVGAGTLDPTYTKAHRWRYAAPNNPLNDRCLVDNPRNLYAAGDWCGGPRVEGAFLSGIAAAEAILAA